MLSGKSQYQKVIYCMISFIEHFRNNRLLEMENRVVVTWAWGWGRVRVMIKGQHRDPRGDESVLYLDCSHGLMNLHVIKLYTAKYTVQARLGKSE